MNPQEKANELFNKYKNLTTYQYQEYAGARPSTFEHDIDTIKQCALISVYEIMQVLSILPYGMQYLSEIDYWEEVKLEIEKL